MKKDILQERNVNKVKQIIILFVILCSFSVRAEYSMRRCTILPVSDPIGGVIGYKVFEEVEKYLKNSDWCFYKHNSVILDILSNYKKNLDSYLDNKEVLKLISEKTKSGSLIKIDIVNAQKGVEVEIKILGGNGEDLLFRDKTSLNTEDPFVIAQTVNNWLDIYEKEIPYDGKVLGVLGNQFTADIGKGYGIYNNFRVKVVRPTKKKKHPLLKEIVDFEIKNIGEGKIIHVTESQSQGKMSQYEGKSRLEVGDWVIIEKGMKGEKPGDTEVKFDETKGYEFGKLGKVGFFFNLGTGEASNSINNSNLKKMGGTVFGVDVKTELWATRKYWGGLDLSRGFSTYKKEEGTLSIDSNSITISKTKFKVAYKYLPLGFFYGPQIDVFAGYASYTYGLDNQASDGFGEVSFSGIMLGTRGNVPLVNAIRLYLGIDFLIGSGYEEQTTIYGEADSTTNYSIETGITYKYSPSMDIEGGFEFVSNKAKFINPEKELSFKNTSAIIGASFTF